MTYLAIDIETVPDLSCWSPPVDKPDAFPPAWAHRIVCVGLAELTSAYLPGREPVAMRADTAEAEPELLRGLSRLLATEKPTLVSFNGRKFDLPVIALRCLRHGVQLPWYYRAKGARYRFSEEGHIDLCDALSDYGAATMLSLDDAARLIGADCKGDIDGSSVDALYRAGRFDEIGRYCLADVQRTVLLFLRYRLVQGELTHAGYERVRSIFASPVMVPDVAIGAGDKPDSHRAAGGVPVSGVVSASSAVGAAR